MPSAENDGKIRPQPLHMSRNCDRRGNHRSREQRDSEAKAILNLFFNPVQIVWVQRAIYDAGFESGCPEGRGQTQQAKRRPDEPSGIGRKK